MGSLYNICIWVHDRLDKATEYFKKYIQYYYKSDLQCQLQLTKSLTSVASKDSTWGWPISEECPGKQGFPMEFQSVTWYPLRNRAPKLLQIILQHFSEVNKYHTIQCILTINGGFWDIPLTDAHYSQIICAHPDKIIYAVGLRCGIWR